MKIIKNDKAYLTTVIDVGARYGIHPSWNDFAGDMKYIAFEPDPEEAESLRKSNSGKISEVIEGAVYNKEGEFDFNLLVHRGMSSFLKPDLESEAFSDLKPGLGNIEKIIKIKTKTFDYYTDLHQWNVDFIKVDTEGTEHEVIESAERTIKQGVLGIRSSVNFNPAFHNQILFSATHDYLVKEGFMLLNIDYFGMGYPKLGLFKKPDPSLPDNQRYGVLVACDAVWIRKPTQLDKLKRCSDQSGLESSVLKLAYFCYLNNAPDVAVDILYKFCREKSGWQLNETRESKLFQALQLHIMEFLGKWRTVPDETWSKVKAIFETIYGFELQGGSKFYPQIQGLASKLKKAI